MALKAFLTAVTVAAVMVGMALPTPSSGRAAPVESQIATMTVGAG